jgi:hypothetical protein
VPYVNKNWRRSELLSRNELLWKKVTEPFYSFMESDVFGKPSVDLGVMTRLLAGRPGILRCPSKARGFSFPKLGNQSVLAQYFLE